MHAGTQMVSSDDDWQNFTQKSFTSSSFVASVSTNEHTVNNKSIKKPCWKTFIEKREQVNVVKEEGKLRRLRTIAHGERGPTRHSKASRKKEAAVTLIFATRCVVKGPLEIPLRLNLERIRSAELPNQSGTLSSFFGLYYWSWAAAPLSSATLTFLEDRHWLLDFGRRQWINCILLERPICGEMRLYFRVIFLLPA